MPVIPMSEFKSGQLVQCAAAPEGCNSYVGREGLLYSASEKLHGAGATWIWNMRFTGGAAEVPVREGDGFVFVKPGAYREHR